MFMKPIHKLKQAILDYEKESGETPQFIYLLKNDSGETFLEIKTINKN